MRCGQYSSPAFLIPSSSLVPSDLAHEESAAQSTLSNIRLQFFESVQRPSARRRTTGNAGHRPIIWLAGNRAAFWDHACAEVAQATPSISDEPADLTRPVEHALISLAAEYADVRWLRAHRRVGLRHGQHKRAANRSKHSSEQYNHGAGHE